MRLVDTALHLGIGRSTACHRVACGGTVGTTSGK